jgi:hypothetical protein
VRISELFEVQTWTIARIALGRLGVDPRARKQLGSILFCLCAVAAAPCFLVLFVVMMAVAPETITSAGIFLGLAIGLGIRQLRLKARRDAMLEEAAAAVPDSARQSIFRVTYWLAILLRRCESEYALLKEMPPEIEVVTRRVLLNRLRAHGIWEEMPIAARDLLLKADGHWTELERRQVVDKFEFLCCLRWIAGKDNSLRWLTLPSAYKRSHVNEIAMDSNWFRPGLTVAPGEVEARLQTTAGMLERCGMEAVARGLFPADPEKRARAVEEKRRIDAAGASTDWLYGPQTISSLTDQTLHDAHRRALLRFRLLRAALSEMAAKQGQETLAELMEAGLRTQIVENE